MSPMVQTAQYSFAAYNAKITNHWIQVIVYVLLAISIVGTLAAALFCIARGGSLEWIWYFGIYVKVACKFNR